VISIILVLGLFVAFEALLRANAVLRLPGYKYWEFAGSALAGSVPLALLGVEVIERNGVAVILALVGFAYFCLLRKSTYATT
jgi:hypothetical protein